MGMRFRKSTKIGPFRLTASKSGLSVSAGVKGFRVTKTARGGTRSTASIPGTGISFTEEKGAGGKKLKKTQGKVKKFKWWWIAAAFVVLIGLFGSNGSQSKPDAEPSPTPTAEVRAIVETTPRPSVTPRPEPVKTYILNTNSHIFHSEWCSSAEKISDANRKEFEGTRSEVIEQGYEPCQQCKP